MTLSHPQPLCPVSYYFEHEVYLQHIIDLSGLIEFTCSYCECFAAGIYCRGYCSCEDGFNKPENENQVMEAKQQIKSRNPLAFAPKIVQCTTNVPSNTV